MRTDDIATVLQIRRAHERSAEAALLRAQQAAAHAVAQRKSHDHAVALFMVQRQAREAAIAQTLTEGPVAAHRLRMAAAELASISAHAESLRQNAAQAVRKEFACADKCQAAQAGLAAAAREALGALTLRQRIDTAARIASARKADSKIEEASAASRNVGAAP